MILLMFEVIGVVHGGPNSGPLSSPLVFSWSQPGWSKVWSIRHPSGPASGPILSSRCYSKWSEVWSILQPSGPF